MKPFTYFCGRLYYACVNEDCENYFDQGVYDRRGNKIADSSVEWKKRQQHERDKYEALLMRDIDAETARQRGGTPEP